MIFSSCDRHEVTNICHMCLFWCLRQLCVSCHHYTTSIYGENRVITAAQALYLWADYYMGMTEKLIPLRKDFTSVHILAFSATSLIKVTIKALIIPCCERAVKIIFITNTSFISECVSVMIIRALSPWSHSKSILWALWGSDYIECSSNKQIKIYFF